MSLFTRIFLVNSSIVYMQVDGFFNLFPNKPWSLRVSNTSLLKTLWEKGKLLVTSNFSFSHSVFYPFRELTVIFIGFKIVVCKLFQIGRVLKLSFGKGLRVFSSCQGRRHIFAETDTLRHGKKVCYNCVPFL